MTGTSIADVLPEPCHGTHLVRVEYDSAFTVIYTVIWRDDAAPNRVSEHPDKRWLTDDLSAPKSWQEILAHATAVHAIAEQALAVRVLSP